MDKQRFAMKNWLIFKCVINKKKENKGNKEKFYAEK